MRETKCGGSVSGGRILPGKRADVNLHASRVPCLVDRIARKEKHGKEIAAPTRRSGIRGRNSTRELRIGRVAVRSRTGRNLCEYRGSRGRAGRI